MRNTAAAGNTTAAYQPSVVTTVQLETASTVNAKRSHSSLMANVLSLSTNVMQTVSVIQV